MIPFQVTLSQASAPHKHQLPTHLQPTLYYSICFLSCIAVLPSGCSLGFQTSELSPRDSGGMARQAPVNPVASPRYDVTTVGLFAIDVPQEVGKRNAFITLHHCPGLHVAHRAGACILLHLLGHQRQRNGR